MELFLIILLFAAFAFWWDSRRTSEIALRQCAMLCERSSVQLLDSSVSMQRMWLQRTDSWLQICRLYSFEFSGDGDSRRFGYVVLLGSRVVEHHMDPWPVN